MKILYLHQYFTTPDLGGGTRSYEFAKRWAAAGHHVYVVTGNDLTSAKVIGVKVISTKTPYRNEMTPSERVRAFVDYALNAVIRGIGFVPDVIYATSTPLTVGISAFLLSRYHRIPYVFEVRDLWPEAPIQMGVIRNPGLKYFLRRFEKAIYRHAVHIVALSPGMVDGVVATGVPVSKVSMVPNACDIELFKPGPLDVSFLVEKGLPVRPTIAYAGALGDANGIDVLAEAVGILQKRRTNVQVVVAGEGRRLSTLEEAKSRWSLTNLWLVGKVPKGDVARLYRASLGGLVTFSAIPILQTNSPNKFFDLLAAGKAVITNMSGWIAHLVKTHNVGCVALPGDPESLADAIERAADPHTSKAMGQAARQLAETQFSRDRLASKVLQIVEGVVDKSYA